MRAALNAAAGDHAEEREAFKDLRLKPISRARRRSMMDVYDGTDEMHTASSALNNDKQRPAVLDPDRRTGMDFRFPDAGQGRALTETGIGEDPDEDPGQDRDFDGVPDREDPEVDPPVQEEDEMSFEEARARRVALPDDPYFRRRAEPAGRMDGQRIKKRRNVRKRGGGGPIFGPSRWSR